MHNIFTEEAMLRLSGPGRQVALLYARWKLEQEFELFKVKASQILAKLECNILEQDQVVVA